MRIPRFFRPLSFACILLVTLAACESAEERAEAHYQSGLALIEEGDYARALVEFRNVFELDSSHQEARQKYAQILLEQEGNRGAAFRQYLRLAEQYPDDLTARINLAEIAFVSTNWEEMVRHGEKAQELAPDNIRVEAIGIALAYRQAALDEEEAARREQGRAAQNLLSDFPDSIILRNLLVDVYMRDNDAPKAIDLLDALIEQDPDRQIYWRQRLGLLSTLGDIDAIEAQLKEMVERFPDSLENKQVLLRFYLSRNQSDKAETFLRELVTTSEGPGARADLVNFLLRVRGPDAARPELEKAIAEEANPVPFQVIQAGIDFSDGARETAITDLEKILETSQQDAAALLTVRLTLARMLLTTGNDVGARARVQEILMADETNPEALKMQAVWQIEADDADTAINTLRMVLDRAPEDADAMTLMAQAYTRTGRPELAQEFLALAVEASGNAPEETLRYTRVLMSRERYLPAEDILLPALKLAPQNVELLSALGELYLRMEDAGRLEQVITTLNNLDTTRSRQLATQLEAERLNQVGSVEDAIAYLEGVNNTEDANLNTGIALIRAQLTSNDKEAALVLAREMQDANPDNVNLRALLASVEAINGNVETAETTYRDILANAPNLTRIWLELARVVQITEGRTASAQIVTDALAANPGNANLLWASASHKERDGDIDGAIDIYEELYARDTGSIVVANNLASLLSTYRAEDPESIDRAWNVARRFRGSEVPAMQDTFGWILHLRGDSEEALSYMESAAEGLPRDPIVQYHLAQIYSALERPQDALVQYRRALDVAAPTDERAQIVAARSRIKELESAPAPEQ